MALGQVTVFGGAGFLGRHLIQRLAPTGAVIRVAGRDPEKAMFLKPLGDVGQIVPVRADIVDRASVDAVVDGVDAVVNFVGILAEGRRRTFDAIHRQGAGNVAEAARDAGAERLVHISAIGASKRSPSAYARTKAQGEEAVHSAFPDATILRPSIVFGPEDNFFNQFAAMTRLLPALPVFVRGLPRLRFPRGGGLPRIDLFRGGGPRFQPVYVGDVADAVMKALQDPECRGKTYELGGPETYTFKELMEIVLRETRRRRFLAPIPFFVANMQAAILERLPGSPLTRDQVKQLRRDNVVGRDALTFADLGITPTALEAVVPAYLDRFRPPGRVERA